MQNLAGFIKLPLNIEKFIIEQGIATEIGSPSDTIEVKNELDFEEKLKIILASERLNNVLKSILSLSK